jgi:hypothetical protein
MKKLILVTLLAFSSVAYATSVNSVRGSFGFVELSNSYSKMIGALGKPESSYNHIVHDRDGWPHKATTHSYTIDNQKYQITIVDGVVYSIDWER